MTRWLVSVRYSPQGAAGVAKAGLGSRREALRSLAEAQGGKLVDFWGSGVSEWDAVFILEMPGAASRMSANSLLTRASGTIEVAHAQELYDCEEIDQHLRQGVEGWRPAGE